MKGFLKILIAIILAVFIFLLVMDWLSIQDHPKSAEEEHVKQRLEEALAKEINPIPVNFVTNFNWREVCIGQGNATIHGKKSMSRLYENYWLLGFLLPDDSIKLFRMPKDKFHYPHTLKSRGTSCIPRGETVRFKVTRCCILESCEPAQYMKCIDIVK